MKKLLLALFFLIIGSLIISCQREKKEPKVIEAEDMLVIMNENTPTNPSLSFQFEEELSLTKEGWWPSQILVDDEGNIYVAHEKENTIYKFDSHGIQISKKQFSKGQGPGEFTSMALCRSSDGKFYVYDRRQFRLTVMNEDYGVQDLLKFGEMRWEFKLDSEENLFFWTVKFLPGTTDAQRLVLSKFSSSGNLLFEIFEYTWSVYNVDGSKIEYKYPLYKRYGMYKLDPESNVYYAISDKYEINIVSKQGKLFKKIMKKGLARKVTEMDIEKAMYYFPWSSKPRNEIIIPEHMPYIADFFILENNYLLVVTFENTYDKETLAGDLFDEKGIFQAQIEVPKYYRWFELIGPGSSNALVKNNHFYTIEADEEEENFYVKQYKIIWSNK